MPSTDNPDWPVRVKPIGMVPPSLPDVLRGGADGVVQEGGAVVLDEIGGTHLRLKDTSAIKPETRVYVFLSRGSEWCKPLEVREQELKEKKAQEYLKVRERKRDRAQTRREAEEFWDRYDLPFEWDVTIKGRRSGLLRGSSGTGRDSRTVEHLYVLEEFHDGRLHRSQGVYLCNDEAKFRFDEGIRHQDEDGNAFIPPVTCQQCLNLMERWESETSPTS